MCVLVANHYLITYKITLIISVSRMTFLSTPSVLPAPSSPQCLGISTRMSDATVFQLVFPLDHPIIYAVLFSKHLLQLGLHMHLECLTTLAA